jgi:hypothetical protein
MWDFVRCGDIMLRKELAVAALSISVLFLVCMLSQVGAESEVTVSGTLGQVVEAGGETTGWAIHLDRKVTIQDREVSSLEVSGRGRDLVQLNGQHVEATGTIVIRHGVERGDWPVLEIRMIRALKLKAEGTDLASTRTERWCGYCSGKSCQRAPLRQNPQNPFEYTTVLNPRAATVAVLGWLGKLV